MAYTAPEPLRGMHSLQEFDCGEPSLTDWLRRYARQAEATGSARAFVSTDDGNRVVGYFALAAGAVQPADATLRLLKGQSQRFPVPVVLLARLAVDRGHQGKGLGVSLLQSALLKFVEAAEVIGARALVAHALNENAARFYMRFGFEASPTDSLHLILLDKDLRKLVRSIRR